MGDSEFDSASTGSPPQEYFPLPTSLKFKQILSNYKANIPPVFVSNVKKGVLKRVPYPGEVTRIKKATRTPARSVPRNGLDAWKDATPDVKLPDFREQSQGDIYYTRGRLCKSLNKTKPEFDLGDPNNQRKVLELKEYSALHDPHCKTYFRNPTVMKHLKKQRLINDRGEVLCSVNEFNHYRSYLAALFCDQVRRRIDDSIAMKELERGLKMAIASKQKSRESYRSAKYKTKVLEMHRAYVEATRQKNLAKINSWNGKLREIERQKAQMSRIRSEKYTFKHWNAFKTRQKAERADENRKRKTLVRIAYADTKNDYTTKYDKFVKFALLERYKADQAAIMIARDDQIDDMQELVDESLRKSRSSWIHSYDTFINRCRRDPLKKLQERKNAQARVRYLMRKYFDLWIDFIIRRRELKSYDLHHSVFDVERKLKPFVDKMRNISDSDLESDDELACGDNACIRQKRKATIKLTHLVRIYPSPLRLEMPSVRTLTTASHTTATASRKGLHTDGHEADLDEADEFIDRMVERYRLQNEHLQERLRTGSPPKKNEDIKKRVHTDKTLSKIQSGKKDAIRMLTDVNEVLKSGDKNLKKGWRAMKL